MAEGSWEDSFVFVFVFGGKESGCAASERRAQPSVASKPKGCERTRRLVRYRAIQVRWSPSLQLGVEEVEYAAVERVGKVSINGRADEGGVGWGCPARRVSGGGLGQAPVQLTCSLRGRGRTKRERRWRARRSNLEGPDSRSTLADGKRSFKKASTVLSLLI